MGLLQEFETYAGLGANDVALLIGCPRPTYYQYRRTDHMPVVVRRFVETLMNVPKNFLDSLIAEYVYGTA